MFLTGALIGSLGLACIVCRTTLLGVVSGFYLILMGATTSVLVSGGGAKVAHETHLIGVVLILVSVMVFAIGCSAVVRHKDQRKSIRLKDTQDLRSRI